MVLLFRKHEWVSFLVLEQKTRHVFLAQSERSGLQSRDLPVLCQLHAGEMESKQIRDLSKSGSERQRRVAVRAAARVVSYAIVGCFVFDQLSKSPFLRFSGHLEFSGFLLPPVTVLSTFDALDRMDLFFPVTVIDITTKNVDEVGPLMLESIRNADFVAIDQVGGVVSDRNRVLKFALQELSGLGNTSGRGRLDVAGYYKHLREAVSTRRTISLGVSCFRTSTEFVKPHEKSCDPLSFSCTTFNILLFPDGRFEMDGSAKRFLVTHGFDLNRWTEYGIGYSQRGVKVDFMTNVVSSLLRTQADVVFHNGLADLAYFYDSFWGTLPKSHQTFTAEVADMFGDRLFDTKVICRTILNWRMHSLEYCFKKSQRINKAASTAGKPAVVLRHGEGPSVNSDLVIHIPVKFTTETFARMPEVGKDVCELMYNYGFCNAFKQGTCQHPVELHQMDLILDIEEHKNQRKRKREEESAFDWLKDLSLAELLEVAASKLDSTGTTAALEDGEISGSSSSDTGPDNDEPTGDAVLVLSPFGPPTFAYPSRGRGCGPRVMPERSIHPQRLGTNHHSMDNGKSYNVEFGLHSAGFDAFMTGYVYATCLGQLGRTTVDGRARFKNPEKFVNGCHATGKPDPYWFRKSDHIKAGAVHAEKMARVRAAVPGV